MDDEIEEGMVHYSQDLVESKVDPFKYKIHVSNLEKEVTEQMLGNYFSKFGNVLEVKIIRKMSNDKGYNYAFVTFERVESASKALVESEGWSVKSALRNNNYPISQTTKRIQRSSRSRSISNDQPRQNKKRKPDFKPLNKNNPQQQYTPPPQNQPQSQLQLQPSPTPPTQLPVYVPAENQGILGTDLKLIQQNIQLYGVKLFDAQILVRELFVSGVPKEIPEDYVRKTFAQFGEIEKIDIHPKTVVCYVYAKYRRVEQAQLAYNSANIIQQLLQNPSFIKVYFSDPIRRYNIVGNSLHAEDPASLSNILFVGFPQMPYSVDVLQLKKILESYTSKIKTIYYKYEDPQHRQYCLFEYDTWVDALNGKRFLIANQLGVLQVQNTEVNVLASISERCLSYSQTQYINNYINPTQNNTLDEKDNLILNNLDQFFTKSKIEDKSQIQAQDDYFVLIQSLDLGQILLQYQRKLFWTGKIQRGSGALIAVNAYTLNDDDKFNLPHCLTVQFKCTIAEFIEKKGVFFKLEGQEQYREQFYQLKKYLIEKNYIGIVKLEDTFIYVNVPHEAEVFNNEMMCMFGRK